MIALLVGVLLIALAPALSQLFGLQQVEPLDMAVIGVAAAVWVFLVHWARKRHLLERFLETTVAR